MKRYILRIAVLATAILSIGCKGAKKASGSSTYYLGSTGESTVNIYTIDDGGSPHCSGSLVRGTAVSGNKSEGITCGDTRYIPINTGSTSGYVPESALVPTRTDAVAERTMYVRTPASIISDCETSRICGLADKGDALEILGYDSLCPDGRVLRYKVRNRGCEGYVYGKYLVNSRDKALERYDAGRNDPLHGAVKNPFGGGEAAGCDFYPVERPQIEGNTMPESCYTLYLTSSPAVLNNIENYIALAKRTKINAFVITLKDNENPGFKAEAMRLYSPTNYNRADGGNAARIERAVKRLHEEGFYTIARITCFKDSYYVADHLDTAITEIATGQPFKYNKAFWPSAYDRNVWQFNIELAKEAVRRFGFNEINLDYVRFPELPGRYDKLIDYHNTYNESKVQAIQRFVTYACDEIHAAGAYVSIDVFGESANQGYTTSYGQYWPALSNVTDVICGMPYPDHFSDGYYGISKPWNHPYELLNAWGRHVQNRQSETTTPAKVRTWIQAYDVMRYVDRNGIAYNAENVEKEIRALYDAGLTGGYITWMSSASIAKYEQQEAAFKIDYHAEYKRRSGR